MSAIQPPWGGGFFFSDDVNQVRPAADANTPPGQVAKLAVGLKLTNEVTPATLLDKVGRVERGNEQTIRQVEAHLAWLRQQQAGMAELKNEVQASPEKAWREMWTARLNFLFEVKEGPDALYCTALPERQSGHQSDYVAVQVATVLQKPVIVLEGKVAKTFAPKSSLEALQACEPHSRHYTSGPRLARIDEFLR